MDLSRVDRVLHTIDPAKLAATGLTITGVTVAVLPVRGAPTAATVWVACTSYTAPTTAEIRLAGPDADSTAALAVPADCDLWALVTDGTQTEAVKIERLTVQNSTGTIVAPGVPFVTSVQGRNGAVVLTASDVGADAAGAAAAAQSAAIAAIPSMGTIAADPALRAAFVPLQATPPNHTVSPVYVDTSTMPPTIQYWTGSAWAALGVGGLTIVDNGDGTAAITSGATSVTDNGDGTASTTSSSVTDHGDGTALAA